MDSRWISPTDVKFDPHTLVNLSSTVIIVAVSWRQCYDRLRTVESSVRYSRGVATVEQICRNVPYPVVHRAGGERRGVLGEGTSPTFAQTQDSGSDQTSRQPAGSETGECWGNSGKWEEKRNFWNLRRSTNYNYCSIQGDVIINVKVSFLLVPCLLFRRRKLIDRRGEPIKRSITEVVLEHFHAQLITILSPYCSGQAETHFVIFEKLYGIVWTIHSNTFSNRVKRFRSKKNISHREECESKNLANVMVMVDYSMYVSSFCSVNVSFMILLCPLSICI